MRHVLSVLIAPLALAACVATSPGPDRITTLLAGKTVTYPGGETYAPLVQTWAADGTTDYDGRKGRWKSEDDRYCSMFGAATRWTCWRVTTSDGGRAIRFREITDNWFLVGDITGYFTG